jgi:Immunity protein 50
MIDYIENIEKLSAALGTSSFGDFHDGEIVSVSLNRKEPVSLVLVLQLHYRLGETERDGKIFGSWRHFDVTFDFHGVRNCELDGFNHQNVIGEMIIVRVEESFLVHFKQIFGCDLKFLCERMIMADVVSKVVEKVKFEPNLSR